jgi:Tfp pilus assembly protein PilV
MMRRLRSEAGFGLIEMLAAIVLIDIAILTLLLTLNSGMVSLRRSAELSTASVLADKQMEQYRAGTYSAIYLDSTSLASVDSTYTGDSAYSTTQVNQTCSPLASRCMPTQTVTGPDGKSYRIDTYIALDTTPGLTSAKNLTVVVRRTGTTPVLARAQSTFGPFF